MNRTLLVIFFSVVLVVSTERTGNKIECYSKLPSSSIIGKCEGYYCYKKVSAYNDSETIKLGCTDGSDIGLPKPGNCTNTIDERYQARIQMCICSEHKCNGSSMLSFKFTLTLLSLLFLTHQWFNC